VNETILYELLEGLEWKDLELKESRTKVPESAYETVSAFLNTEGGHIVLGVKDKKEIVGVLDVDKIQSDFIGNLQTPEKFGHPIHFDEYLKQHDNNNVLIFYIHEAHRKDKPIYVKTKRQGRVAFIRKGGDDYTCSKQELDRMIADAQTERPDSQLLDLNPDDCFDQKSLKWFRHRYENKGGNRSLDGYSDNDFLVELGLLVEQKGNFLPTLASVLLLGKTSRIRQFMPRPIVDCYRYGFPRDHANTGQRWDNRVTCEYNIVTTWQAIVNWYNSFTETPFEIDRVSGQRTDSPPDFIAFRETVINLLSHQDFTDHTRWPVIEDFNDQTRFWNPGDAFANVDKLLEPGVKEVRNPIIVRALRDIGFSEQSGWGLREVYRNCHELGRVPPELCNDKSEKSFELRLMRQQLMSEQQILLQTQIGIHLKPQEAAAFANLCSADNTQISRSALQAALGLNGMETTKIITRLITQGVVTEIGEHKLKLADHLEELRNQILDGNQLKDAQPEPTDKDLTTDQVERLTPDLTTDQVEPLTELTDKQRELLSYCDVPRSMTDIMERMDIGSRSYFRENHLIPLLTHGLLAMTNPNPKASNQSYVITENGVELKQALNNSE
jgi:ATP-dependent DNA helicase RecG